MKFIKIIILLTAIIPFMSTLSGCSADAFLDAMKEEEDFIAPFDVVISTEEAKRTTYFPISDTGLEAASSVATGDDASYSNKLPAMSFTETNIPNGNTYLDDRDTDDIVTDNVTGLVWTKCSATAPNKMDVYDNCSGSTTDDLSDTTLMEWSKAVSMCKSLDYAGRKDWRLPRLPELLTIVNYSLNPAIDPIFENTQKSFTSPIFTKDRYSPDIRDHYRREGTAYPYTFVLDSTGKYVIVNGKYVYEDNDAYMPDEYGDHIFVYVPASIFDGSGNATISGEVIHIENKDRYNYEYNFFLGWGYYQNNTGTYAKIYIKDNEYTYKFDGSTYTPDDAGSYVRVYVPSPGSGKYNFDIVQGKYLDDAEIDGQYNQATYKTDTGYWTYSSKLYVDDFFNTADYGWIVFHQGGGTFGLNISTYKLKLKPDLVFERQYVRCVSGGNGDSDD